MAARRCWSPLRVGAFLRLPAPGNPVGSGPVEPELARWAGQVLAALHGLRVRPRDRSLFPVPGTDTASRWPALTEAAQRSGVAWARQLSGAAPAVSLIAELARSAGYRPDQEVNDSR